jgi:hypothetical protein
MTSTWLRTSINGPDGRARNCHLSCCSWLPLLPSAPSISAAMHTTCFSSCISRSINTRPRQVGCGCACLGVCRLALATKCTPRTQFKTEALSYVQQADLLAVGLHTSHNKGSTKGFKLSSIKPSTEQVCHVEEHAEYEGAEVIKWGAENMQVGGIGRQWGLVRASGYHASLASISQQQLAAPSAGLDMNRNTRHLIHY